MQHKTIRIHPDDNIEVALADLPRGTSVGNGRESYRLVDTVLAKHKYAATEIGEGEEITMYGVLVGKATKDIPKGGLISLDNIRHAASSFSVRGRNTKWNKPDVSKWTNRTFHGFYRSDGSVGTANQWLIIPMVFCENQNVDALQEGLLKALGYKESETYYEKMVSRLTEQYLAGRDPSQFLIEGDVDNGSIEKQRRIFPNIDGIKVLKHTMGCAGTKDDTATLCGLLAGYITHPNTAGATVLSLGCQNAQLPLLEGEIKKRDPGFSKPLFLLEQQKIGSEKEMLEQAIRETFNGLIRANKQQREPAPISKLCIGLECGGSDGFSGISANPALGCVSDIMVALGGTVILSEFPELCGVEQNLSDRCVDEGIAGIFSQLMKAYQQRAEAIGSGFDSNPSAGNLRDGLITDAIKSAGAAKKGGNSPVTDVLDYPARVTRPGLNLLCTPGSDIESTTAEVGSGATVVLFTTGLGTPTGNPIAPVLKLSTNSALYKKMNDIIDIDTGTIIAGTETTEEVAERILEHVIRVASGEVKAKADGHDDFIPWKRGISL